MRRTWLTLGIVAAVALAASAQGPPAGKSAAEQLRLFRTHRPLIDQLLDQSLKLAEAGDVLDRADRCREVMLTLSKALAEAAAEPDADPSKVAELGGHLAAVVRDGFGPALAEAAFYHGEGTDGYKRLVDLRLRARADLAVAQGFKGDGAVGRSPQVAAARKDLDAAVSGLPADDTPRRE